MASFNRADYERIFAFAVQVYLAAEPRTKLRKEAVEVMNMVEGCIGQLDRPDRRP
jgi:hypothetical protein